MKKLFIVLAFFISLFFINQKAEAKIWTKDLVDKVSLESGYKFSLCTIDLKYNRIGQADNILSVQEKDFEANSDAYPCNKQSEGNVLFANITLYFNKTNWNGGSAYAKLVEFQNELYSLNYYSGLLDDGFTDSKGVYADLAGVDWFSTTPGLHAIRGRDFINTNPSAKGASISNSSFIIIHDPATGKFTSALFLMNNVVYKLSTIINQVTVPATLVDYTYIQPTTTISVSPTSTPALTGAPTYVLYPASTASPNYVLTPTPTAAPILPNTVINSVSPSSGPAGQEIIIKGYNFGSSAGYVMFCLQGNCSYGAAPIISWSDTQIKARVPGTFTQAASYELYVNNKNGKSSNRVAFAIAAGQPIINSISPNNISPALNITLSGSNFGSSGQVNFYKNYPALSGTGIIESWSSTQIVLTIPSSLDGNTEYGIEVVNNGGAKSSFKYYTLGPKLVFTDYEYPVVESLSVNASALYLSTGLVCLPSPSTKIAAGIWDFGDGTNHTFQILDNGYSSSPGRKESINSGHSYASPGTYTVIGKCKDDTGKLSAQVSKSVTVSN